MLITQPKMQEKCKSDRSWDVQYDVFVHSEKHSCQPNRRWNLDFYHLESRNSCCVRAAVPNSLSPNIHHDFTAPAKRNMRFLRERAGVSPETEVLQTTGHWFLREEGVALQDSRRYVWYRCIMSLSDFFQNLELSEGIWIDMSLLRWSSKIPRPSLKVWLEATFEVTIHSLKLSCNLSNLPTVGFHPGVRATERVSFNSFNEWPYSRHFSIFFKRADWMNSCRWFQFQAFHHCQAIHPLEKNINMWPLETLHLVKQLNLLGVFGSRSNRWEASEAWNITSSWFGTSRLGLGLWLTNRLVGELVFSCNIFQLASGRCWQLEFSKAGVIFAS